MLHECEVQKEGEGNLIHETLWKSIASNVAIAVYLSLSLNLK